MSGIGLLTWREVKDANSDEMPEEGKVLYRARRDGVYYQVNAWWQFPSQRSGPIDWWAHIDNAYSRWTTREYAMAHCEKHAREREIKAARR